MRARSGNAVEAGKVHRGWFVGAFIQPPDLPLNSKILEVKWGHHAAGEAREQWSAATPYYSLAILVTGFFRLQFEDGDILLRAPGDFAAWDPGVAHTWRADEESTVVTVRWQESGFP